MSETSSSASGLVGFISAALMYTCLGFLVGVIYALVAPGLSLPAISVWTILGVWWLWCFVFTPPIVVFVSVFRATDPSKQKTVEAEDKQ
jgi:hypothetical protein